MRKPKATDASPSPQTLTLQHVAADNLRAVYADSVMLSPSADSLGAMIRFAFTRMENQIVSESFPIIKHESHYIQQGLATFESNQRKIVEAIVLMRPDHAIQLANAIEDAIKRLPQEIRDRYQIAYKDDVNEDPGE